MAGRGDDWRTLAQMKQDDARAAGYGKVDLRLAVPRQLLRILLSLERPSASASGDMALSPVYDATCIRCSELHGRRCGRERTSAVAACGLV